MPESSRLGLDHEQLCVAAILTNQVFFLISNMEEKGSIFYIINFRIRNSITILFNFQKTEEQGKREKACGGTEKLLQWKSYVT